MNAVILDGGKAPNIIPDYAKIRMEFRTASLSRLEEVDEMIKKCANAAAMALDCTVSLSFGLSDFYDMVRIPLLEDTVIDYFKEFGLCSGSVQPATWFLRYGQCQLSLSFHPASALYHRGKSGPAHFCFPGSYPKASRLRSSGKRLPKSSLHWC